MPRIEKRDSVRPRERVDDVKHTSVAAPAAEPSPVDAMGAPGVAAAVVAAAQPYGKLAALGAFKGFVSTPVGDVHVEVTPGKSGGARPPVVFLDGLDACGRPVPTDETVVRIDLIGQRNTLARDIAKNGARSVGRDIDPQAQIDAVIGALDALGVTAPVHILGLSYGGMIAALTKKAHPDRVDTLMLCAPYVHSTACGDPVRDTVYALTMQNPFNPLGAFLYRAAARAALAGGVVTVPPQLMMAAPLYAEAMYRLSMGLEGKRLDVEVKGMTKVNILAAPGDVMSPTLSAMAAADVATGGTFTLAPPHLALQHDLVRMAPGLVRAFIDKALGKETTS